MDLYAKLYEVIDMREIWKDVQNYEGLYQVSNLGRVKSLPRNGTVLNERILKPSADRYGYKQVILSKNNNHKPFKVHRLVANSFLLNKNNFPCINHKDENKENNKVDNLEWCSYSYNNAYNGRAKKVAKNKQKKVLCVELNIVFESLAEAEKKTKISAGNICSCCKGRYNMSGGYHWRYCDEN